MANPEHLAILKQGVEVWNEWRKKNPRIKPNLSQVDLTFAELQKAFLYKTDLSGTILVETNLWKANLRESNLNHVNLSGAYLEHANLRSASLLRTDFFGAQLCHADLSMTYLGFTNFAMTWLTDVNMSNAILDSGRFDNIDLSTVKGLNCIHHITPSTIGVDTIYKSKGRIPKVFLRGCGVPDEIIELSQSLKTKASNYFSCFISHSTKDKRFCERLYADLQAKGVRVWYFPEDAKWGESVWGEIDRSIRVYDKLIVVCSKNVLASVPVQREIERALNREDKEHKNVLFPITIDDFIFDEWDHPRKADVLAKVVGDFRGWSHNADKYDKAFKRLLKTLKAA